MGVFDPENTSSTTAPSDHLVGTFGKNGQVGAKGEDYYGRALHNAGHYDSYEVYRSLSIPTAHGQKSFSTDVDVAIANGNKLLLIDVKRWSGKYFWSIFGRPMNGFSRILKDGEWQLSRNMEIAVERYSRKLPGITVEAIVVFVPTSDKRSKAEDTVPVSVRYLIWPGGIPSFRSDESFAHIDDFLGATAPVDPKITRLLTSLAKGK